MKPLRVYVDSSVVGGCLDEEFSEDSKALLELARKGDIRLLLSDVVLEELRLAPQAVQDIVERLPFAVERVDSSAESRALQQAYLRAGVVGAGQANDAHHVALATVSHADVVVSWNFKHIVHWDRIRKFNAVNLVQGYSAMEIRSPRELV